MSGNFSARTNSQTGFSAATRRSLPQHARLGTASSLTRPALPQSEPASGPSSIMIKGVWYKLHGETEAEFALTIWYPAAGDHSKPFIAEISYKYDTKKHDVARETAQRALALLLKLQESTWADPSALTKTSYAKCEESH